MQVYPTTVSPTLRLVRDEDTPDYDGEPIKRAPFTMMDTESHDYVAANMGSHTYSVFAYLCRRINAKTGECHPSVATIAESTAMSARQVRYSLAELEQAGFVTRETRTNAAGLTLGTAYRVTVTPGPARGQVVQPSENGAARKRNGRGTDAERTVAGGAAKLYVGQDENKTDSLRSSLSPHETFDPVPDFDRFWIQYPRHEKRADAVKAWSKVATSPDRVNDILAGLARLAVDYEQREKRYIPQPTSWLNGERWTDDPMPADRTRTNGSAGGKTNFSERANTLADYARRLEAEGL